MGNPSSKSSFKNNNLSKQVNFMGNHSYNNNSKYSGIKESDRVNDVLTKFAWNYGGNSVYLTGSFNNWKKNIAMEKQGDQFGITLLLPRQIHQYKFIVDGEWRFSPEDATMSDDNGYINNYIDTTNFEPLIQGNKNDMDDLSGPLYPTKYSKEKEKQKGKLDKKQQYAKYAPKVPPHYEYCLYMGTSQLMTGKKNIDNSTSKISSTNLFSTQPVTKLPSLGMMEQQSPYTYNPYDTMPTSIQNSSLSSNSNQAQEQPYESLLNDEEIEYLFKTPHSLPMPSHVTLDHIMTQEGQWYTAIAITQRFKQKYTTFTYYSIDRANNSSNMMEEGKTKQFMGHSNFNHRNSI